MGIESIRHRITQPVNIAPLIVFRIAFGALMFLSVLRFLLKGWVRTMYIEPKFFFPYYGFEWVKPAGEPGMYLVFFLLLLTSLFILSGFLYRISTILFFLLFTYVELIDKTNYLNHYYFISLISFIIIFLPAGRAFSIDNRLFKRQEHTLVPAFYLLLLQLQMFVVYFFAGIAKLNYDWLIEAQPLKIWLPAFSHFKIIGQYMEQDWVAYLFSWFGCIYDLLIGYFLFNKRTVNIAYLFVVLFHLATALFFNIGMFPYIMMVITIVFFKSEFHQKILNLLKTMFAYSAQLTNLYKPVPSFISVFFVFYFIVQFLLPFRYLLYPGSLFWTEQGYRFSWRVMLMEKAGTAFFYVKDGATNKEVEVDNKKYLTFLQEKQMSTQPDMMVDYARFLKCEYELSGFKHVKVRATSFVTLNGSPSREFINDSVDLANETNSFMKNKYWIKPFKP